MYIKIKDHPNLVRDMNSKAVLNVNKEAKESFITARDARRREHEKMQSLESDIASLKNKMYAIEILLNKVLDKFS